MTPLEHSDEILKAPPGEVLMVRQPVKVVNMTEGGEIAYGPGARLRVKFASGDLMWFLDENATTVTFSRQDMQALERRPKAMQEG